MVHTVVYPLCSNGCPQDGGDELDLKDNADWRYGGENGVICTVRSDFLGGPFCEMLCFTFVQICSDPQ